MKNILFYLNQHLKETHKSLFIPSFIILLSVLYLIRYVFQFDIYFLQNSFSFIYKILFYLLPITICLALIERAQSFKNRISKQFYILLSLTLTALIINHYYPIYFLLPSSISSSITYFLNKVLFNLHGLLCYLIVPLLYYFNGKQKIFNSFFGLNKKVPSYKPYVILFLISIPFIYWASFQSSFHVFYPRYKPGLIENFLNIPSFLTIGIFESTYTLTFIGVEIFFRGFLIFAFSRYFGAFSIYISVLAYVLLHFGKPFGEALAALFGGYVLSIISYYSKSIWGGIMIHVAIAWLMEFFAYINS